jgi:hypothetical protein
MPFITLDPTSAQPAPITTIGDPLTNEGETLSSLRDELKKDIVRDIEPQRLNRWINLGYLHVAAMLTTSEMQGSIAIPTIVDQPLYLLPRSVAWITQLPLSDPSLYPIVGGKNMLMTDLAQYRDLPDYPSSYTYSPYRWFRQGRLLALWPKPATSASVTVDFRIRPAKLSLETHSPILPEEFHEAILLRARHVAFRSLKMFNEASIAQNDFVASIRDIVNTDAEELKGKPSSFQPAVALRNYYRRGGSTTRKYDHDL